MKQFVTPNMVISNGWQLILIIQNMQTNLMSLCGRRGEKMNDKQPLDPVDKMFSFTIAEMILFGVIWCGAMWLAGFGIGAIVDMWFNI